ncbi:hypothetical protein Dsin_012955 [Dipteronia sinensis]|uniref:Uncharacterized protein n=1 Tax=Dipteronia sinensis TaxID=43782 RepID=A0AAE0AJW4_9ROSI|nr:hypothetical protein Dsin_012955 [Dipteronia sinensis]
MLLNVGFKIMQPELFGALFFYEVIFLMIWSRFCRDVEAGDSGFFFYLVGNVKHRIIGYSLMKINSEFQVSLEFQILLVKRMCYYKSKNRKINRVNFKSHPLFYFCIITLMCDLEGWKIDDLTVLAKFSTIKIF